jgi:hypothetical protein
MQTLPFVISACDQNKNTVIPANAGTHCYESKATFDNAIAEPRVVSRLRGNDNMLVVRRHYA